MSEKRKQDLDNLLDSVPKSPRTTEVETLDEYITRTMPVKIGEGLPSYMDAIPKSPRKDGEFIIGEELFRLDRDFYVELGMRREGYVEDARVKKENDKRESRIDEIVLPFSEIKWVHMDDDSELIDRWWTIKAANGLFITHRDLIDGCPWNEALGKLEYDSTLFEGWTYLGIDKRDGKACLMGLFGT